MKLANSEIQLLNCGYSTYEAVLFLHWAINHATFEIFARPFTPPIKDIFFPTTDVSKMPGIWPISDAVTHISHRFFYKPMVKTSPLFFY